MKSVITVINLIQESSLSRVNQRRIKKEGNIKSLSLSLSFSLPHILLLVGKERQG